MKIIKCLTCGKQLETETSNCDCDDNVVAFKTLCCECKREIVDGMVYYHDKEKGYICECCPGFEKGGIIMPPEDAS